MTSPLSDLALSHLSDASPAASPFVASWEPEMAVRIYQGVQQSNRLPYIVSLCGMPGSGKSISAFLLAKELEQRGLETMVMPHDGYHYSMDCLKTFPDPDDVIYRRGAPDTFDPHALHRDLLRIRDIVAEKLIAVPGFDHAKGDPEPHAHVFDRNRHKVVLCEGLYLLHDGDGWQDIASIFDLRIFMDSDIDACMERVKVRNQCIPGYTRDEILIRTEKVDRVNALKVLRSKPRTDVIVSSLAMAH